MGDRMAKARESAGLSQHLMSMLFAVTPRTVSNWENDAAPPSAATLFMWAHVCDVPLEWLAPDHPMVKDWPRFSPRA